MYKKSIEDKMEQFDPNQYNLVGKELYNMEKHNFVREQCGELKLKIKNLEQ